MKAISEQATGCYQKGKLKFMDVDGEVSINRAKLRLLRNDEVSVPNAGAGSYKEVFEALGFFEVKTIETCSSAGDWTLAIRDKYGWRLAWQENRYPYYGFRYGIDLQVYGFANLEDLIKEWEDLCQR